MHNGMLQKGMVKLQSYIKYKAYYAKVFARHIKNADYVKYVHKEPNYVATELDISSHSLSS